MLSIILIIIIKAIIFNVKIVIIIILMTGRVNGGLIYLGVLGFLGPAPAIASSMFSSFKGKHKRKFAKLIFDTPPPQKKIHQFWRAEFFPYRWKPDSTTASSLNPPLCIAFHPCRSSA